MVKHFARLGQTFLTMPLVGHLYLQQIYIMAFSCISAIQPCCAYPQKRVLTPGLPHAYPVPVVCLPRNGPPLSRCLGAQPCCPCLQKRRCLPLAPPVLPPSWQCAEPDSANGICSASLSCLRELFDGLISPSINVVNGGDQSYVRWFSTRAFEQFPFSLAVVGDIRREEQSLQH